MEIGYGKKGMVEVSHQEKIYQKAQVKNVGWNLGRQRNYSLEVMQSIP